MQLQDRLDLVSLLQQIGCLVDIGLSLSQFCVALRLLFRQPVAICGLFSIYGSLHCCCYVRQELLSRLLLLAKEGSLKRSDLL